MKASVATPTHYSKKEQYAERRDDLQFQKNLLSIVSSDWLIEESLRLEMGDDPVWTGLG